MIQTKIDRTDLLLIDIETVREKKNLMELGEKKVNSWLNVCKSRWPDKDPELLYMSEAGLFPEFSKIICISLGYFRDKDNFKVKAIYGHDEKVILDTFSDSITKAIGKKAICGHNIKEFDIPFIIRRSCVTKTNLPVSLNVYGMKPWELSFVDTREMWKGSAYNLGATTLDAICVCLGITSPKETMAGDMVGTYYYMPTSGIQTIAEYCNDDVVKTAAIYCAMTNGSSKFVVEENIF